MFDPFLLKNEVHFKMHFKDVEGHYDSAPILTSSFVDELQGQCHIFSKYRTEDPSLLATRSCLV